MLYTCWKESTYPHLDDTFCSEKHRYYQMFSNSFIYFNDYYITWYTSFKSLVAFIPINVSKDFYRMESNRQRPCTKRYIVHWQTVKLSVYQKPMWTPTWKCPFPSDNSSLVLLPILHVQTMASLPAIPTWVDSLGHLDCLFISCLRTPCCPFSNWDICFSLLIYTGLFHALVCFFSFCFFELLLKIEVWYFLLSGIL